MNADEICTLAERIAVESNEYNQGWQKLIVYKCGTLIETSTRTQISSNSTMLKTT